MKLTVRFSAENNIKFLFTWRRPELPLAETLVCIFNTEATGKIRKVQYFNISPLFLLLPLYLQIVISSNKIYGITSLSCYKFLWKYCLRVQIAWFFNNCVKTHKTKDGLYKNIIDLKLVFSLKKINTMRRVQPTSSVYS